MVRFECGVKYIIHRFHKNEFHGFLDLGGNIVQILFVYAALPQIWNEFARIPLPVLGITGVQLVCFLLFWGANMWVIYRGIDTIKRGAHGPLLALGVSLQRLQLAKMRVSLFVAVLRLGVGFAGGVLVELVEPAGGSHV